MAPRRPTIPSDLPPALTRGHDHHRCVADALAEAERLCVDRDVRLTELRKRVLELIWGSHAPVGAYAIMDLLRAEGRNAMPPTVYRALDFLLEQGLIHRIASLNAYIGCSHPADTHAMQYLICKRCGTGNKVGTIGQNYADSGRNVISCTPVGAVYEPRTWRR